MMSIKIGDKNKIKNSVIGNNNSQPPKGNFATRHPIIISIITGLLVGFIMLFSFWKDIVIWIEKLFQ
ncbi:hypothetical protein J2Z83_002129 [Virgibacillus natechei]|uniref:Uncharacterized protein n=1 Tax=Virgibacillus natechei TaxID=1216297 RepID=A0ABS4IGE7_9BACI|nr:hypothetical protein [Virgibacillus natechei]